MRRSLFSLLAVAATAAHGYTMATSENDEQVCSGMYAGGVHSYINVTFDNESRGQVAMVIYEWSDADMLGIVSSSNEDLPKTFVCTTDAVRANLCSQGHLGRFIVSTPANVSLTDTSIWTASVAFRNTIDDSPLQNDTVTNATRDPSAAAGLWDNPEGNPDPEDDKWSPYSTPWARSKKREKKRPLKGDALRDGSPRLTVREVPPGGLPNQKEQPHQENTKMPALGEVLWYDGPIHYEVKKTGYYCIGTIPVTVVHQGESGQEHGHASFSGRVLFRNSFDGYLPATDYPKITFYMVMMLVYTLFAAAWGLQCMRHRHDLLPIQNYVSALFGLVVIEMLANWTYYRYLNANGPTMASKIFLFVVSILDAARNSLSFFLLLIVSLGLGVVREELEEINKCRALGVAHAIFGVLYAVGMDLVELETVSALLLLLFVVPLAFTMTAFLLWIMYGLTGTIAELAARKQKYKLGMFKTLYRVLMLAVLAIGAFFVISSLSFSNRYEEDYAPSSWKSRWWLLDGWMVLLYMGVFITIAFLWRPTGSNRRLAMSDELAQDEEDAEDYDLETVRTRGEIAKREAMAGIDEMGGSGGPPPNSEGGIRLRADDEVVFEIGDEGEGSESDDEDSEDEDDGRGHMPRRLSGENGGSSSGNGYSRPAADERKGLIKARSD